MKENEKIVWRFNDKKVFKEATVKKLMKGDLVKLELNDQELFGDKYVIVKISEIDYESVD